MPMIHHSPLRSLLILLALGWLAPLTLADDEAASLVSRCNAPARFADHVAAFTVARETFDFAQGQEKRITFWVIRDGGRPVAALHPGMAQLDMISFDPTRTPEAGKAPPFADFYSWGTLLGSRINVAAWYPDMGPGGEVKLSIAAEEDGKTVRLTTSQNWPQPLDGSATCAMNLRCDPVLGYVWTITTTLGFRHPKARDNGEFIRPEIFNWQVRVTNWGRRHNQRWPAAWDHERTVFALGGDKYVGFYMNPDANDRNKYENATVPDGGFVAKLPGPTGWGIALCHFDKGPATTSNATCNMWADQHNYLKLPTRPDDRGIYKADARWRWQALPPEVVDHILDRVEMDHTGFSPAKTP